jgi:hypothetical protein
MLVSCLIVVESWSVNALGMRRAHEVRCEARERCGPRSSPTRSEAKGNAQISIQAYFECHSHCDVVTRPAKDANLVDNISAVPNDDVA